MLLFVPFMFVYYEIGFNCPMTAVIAFIVW